MGLRNRTVVITRPVDQSAEMVGAIEKHGGRALSFPTIEIVPPESWEQCDEAISHLSRYDGVVATSANAVRAFFDRCTVAGIHPQTPVWAAGSKTRDAVEKFGGRVLAVPEKYSAANLARLMGRGGVAGKRFLFPRGDIARDVLPRGLREAGATVDEVIVYRTISPSTEMQEDVLSALRAGTIDAVTFTSPSSARNFCRMVPEDLLSAIAGKTIFAAIGSTTAEEMSRCGLTPSVVAPSATATSLIEALENYFP